MSFTAASDTGFLSRVKRTTQSINATRRPWSDFLDLSAFNLPLSLSDATTRITQNLTHFRSNYAVITLLALFLSLIYHPVSIIVFLLTLVAWFFLYFARDDPLTVLGFQVDDRVVIGALFAVTVTGLVLTHVWVNVLVSVVVGAVLVILHAWFRSTDDLVMEDQESPFGVLLDDLGGDSARGSYTEWNGKRMELKQNYVFSGVVAKCFDEHNRLLSIRVRLHEHVSLSDHFSILRCNYWYLVVSHPLSLLVGSCQFCNGQDDQICSQNRISKLSGINIWPPDLTSLM